MQRADAGGQSGRSPANKTVVGDRYRLDEVLGQGTWTVYRATDLHTEKEVAIKLLNQLDEAGLGRLRREAKARGRAKSEHIVDVLDVAVTSESEAYIVMELLRGQTLQDRLAAVECFPPEQAVQITSQLLTGLAAAHRAGIVHRDLKPANLFLEDSEQRANFLKILDFGISKYSGDVALTVPGSLLGTPQYMSPEQLSGEAVDQRCDLYAVGVILYELVAGKRPFDASTLASLIPKIFFDPAPPAERITLARLTPIIARALQKSREQRFQSADEFLGALATWERQRAPFTPQPFSPRPFTPQPFSPRPFTPQPFTPPPIESDAVSEPAKADRWRWAAAFAVMAATAAGIALTIRWFGSGADASEQAARSSSSMPPAHAAATPSALPAIAVATSRAAPSAISAPAAPEASPSSKPTINPPARPMVEPIIRAHANVNATHVAASASAHALPAPAPPPARPARRDPVEPMIIDPYADH